MTAACRCALARLVVLVAAACGGGSDRPSVLLVTIDTLRADAASAWGLEQGTTPHLDALAAGGTRFRFATTVTPLTLPAHASLLTGWRPARHGLTVNGVALPSLPAPTLAEQLAAAGFCTAAFVSSTVLDRRHGLAAGFDEYDDRLLQPGGPPAPQERRGDHTVDAAARWIANAETPWFAWVHLYDPHAPYAAPGRPAGDDRAAYLDEVRFADEQLGRLLAALPRDGGPVLVVVTSDHGESLGQHGERTHGVLLGEGALAVPLVLAWWGGSAPATFPRAGQVRDDVASLLDVAPTVLAAVGLVAGGDLDGHDLATAPARERSLPLECRSPAFYYGFSSLAGVRHGVLKLVGATEARPQDWTLYDLASDPEEQHGQVVGDHPLIAAVRSPRPEVEADSVQDAASLAALGYLAGVAPAEGREARDPRVAMDLVAAIDTANTALVAGDVAGARAALAGLAERYGEVAELHLLLGRVARAAGELELAEAALAHACSLQPRSAEAHIQWGTVLLELAATGARSREQASAVLERALALVPDDPDALALLALGDVVFGDPQAALARLAPILRSRPRTVSLLVVQRRALVALGRAAEARAVEDVLRELAPALVDPAAAPAGRDDGPVHRR